MLLEHQPNLRAKCESHAILREANRSTHMDDGQMRLWDLRQNVGERASDSGPQVADRLPVGGVHQAACSPLRQKSQK